MIISKMIKRLDKIKEFEYWPFGVFYIPLYFYGFYLAFKSRSLMYFSATNPGMKYGGVMGESKISVLNKINKDHLPVTMFFLAGATSRQILFSMQNKGIGFPIIIKPDIGERGKAVEKINNTTNLEQYIERYGHQNIIVQEFIDAPIELGILYYRYPNNAGGNISSVVVKEFLTIEGNGKNTLEELIKSHPRTNNRRDYLYKKYTPRLKEIPQKGKKINLEPIGNHCRGTKFLNGNHLINHQLIQVFDNIAHQIQGYYYGRFDLKVNSWDDLYEGKNIKILELNGVSSEPAHMYDPNMKLWQAYKDLLSHAAIIQKISFQNHKLGIPYDKLGPFVKELIHFIFPSLTSSEHKEDERRIPKSGFIH